MNWLLLSIVMVRTRLKETQKEACKVELKLRTTHSQSHSSKEF